MHNFEWISVPGTIFAYRAHFPECGDGLPMHEHDADTYHSVYVERGRVLVYGSNRIWEIELKAGQHYDLTADQQQQHEISALESDTLIWNVYHNVNRRLPPVEYRKGSDHTPITTPV